MKDKKPSPDFPQDEQHHIPNIEIIDLDAEATEPEDTSMSQEEFDEAYDQGRSHRSHKRNSDKSGNFPFRINMHIVLLVVLIIFIAGIAYKFTHWGTRIDMNEINNMEDDQEYLELRNAYDSFLPLITADGDYVFKKYGEDTTILVFGNSPFADDRNSKDNLANIIHDMTGATVYNCAIGDSYLAAGLPSINVFDYPLDAFNFYWLCTLATGDLIDDKYLAAVEILGDDAPAEAMDVYNILKTIDFDTVDVIAVMYDGTDYLAGHKMYSDDNEEDIQHFTGNMVAGINLLKAVYPHIRFIVMSPTYAYGIDENGEYISSDVQRYGQDVLSTYCLKQYGYCYSSLHVTFIDNLYGTITEDNASDYLIDHFHLNVAGRKKVAERFTKALKYYNDYDDSASNGQ